MGKLVAHHIGHQLLLVLRACLRVEQKQRLAAGDAPEVLHRASRKIGQGDHVDLLAWVGDAVVALEPLECNSPNVERQRGEMRLSGHVNDSQGCAGNIDRFGGFKLAHDDGDQIRTHRKCVVERYGRATVCCSGP